MHCLQAAAAQARPCWLHRCSRLMRRERRCLALLVRISTAAEQCLCCLAVAVPHSFKQLWHTALRQRIRVLLLLQQLRCIVGVGFLCAAQRGVAFGVFKQRVCPRSKQVLHNGLLRRSVMQCCFGASLLKHRELRSGKAGSHVDCISSAYYRCCQSSRTSSSTQEYQLAEGSAWYSTERFCCSALRHGFRFCAASAAFSTLCCRKKRYRR